MACKKKFETYKIKTEKLTISVTTYLKNGTILLASFSAVLNPCE